MYALISLGQLPHTGLTPCMRFNRNLLLSFAFLLSVAALVIALALALTRTLLSSPLASPRLATLRHATPLHSTPSLAFGLVDLNTVSASHAIRPNEVRPTFFFSSIEMPPGPMLTRSSRPPTIATARVISTTSLQSRVRAHELITYTESGSYRTVSTFSSRFHRIQLREFETTHKSYLRKSL